MKNRVAWRLAVVLATAILAGGVRMALALAGQGTEACETTG
jgi:hypothetical protein